MYFLTNRLSIKAKLLLILLSISVLSALAVGYLGYSSGKEIITDRISDQLTSLRTAKADQIESYFHHINNLVEVLGYDEMMINAMRAFQTAYHELQSDTIPPEWEQELLTYYTIYTEKLGQNLDIRQNPRHYLPVRNKSKYLQYHYIAHNAHPVGQKNLLEAANDEQKYNQVHQRYHSTFNDLIEKFGFDDIFFIDNDSGDVIYTVHKESDYATNLYYGPYRESNLAHLVEKINRDKDLEKAQLTDFSYYRPSYAAPAAFIATPIYDNFEMIGILAFQLPVDKIDRIMTGQEKWADSGLGVSGETYLVGIDDQFMRSTSRFLLEDKKTYQKTVTELGLTQEVIDKLLRFNTTILQQEANPMIVKQLAGGYKKTVITNSYLDKAVLSSYAPLSINGLNWGIVAERELEEAYQPLYNFERKLLTYLVIIVVGITFISIFIAVIFIRPIQALKQAAESVAEGNTEALVTINTKDEFGDLAIAFNHMVQNIKEKETLIKQKSKENERLLLNILPKPVVKRLQTGEKYLGEEFTNASLFIADIIGFEELANHLPPQESTHLLNQLIDSFDAISEKHGIEKVKSIGAGYMATCGLSEPRLDHAKRIVDFALAFKDHIQHFNHQHQADLGVRIGISSGSITAGIIGKKKFIYDLWGNVVDLAQNIKQSGTINEIQVPSHVYQHLKGMYEFEELTTIMLPNQQKEIQVWGLKQPKMMLSA